MSADRGRKLSLLFYELFILVSGLYLLETLWKQGFILDTVLVYGLVWLLFAIVGGYYYYPRSAESGIVP